MHPHQRQTEILTAVKSRGTCSILELANELDVSDETIRRNIKPLVRDGVIVKVHGGIVLNKNLEPEPPFARRMNEHIKEKQAIAMLVADIIADGDSIILDTGSTTAYVARALSERCNLSVVTNCTEIGRTLARESSNRVHISGGMLRPDDWATFGSSTIDFVSQFHVSFAILSIGAVSDSGNFMDYHLEEAEFSRAVIQQARKTIVVADHSKFSNTNFVKVCGPEKIDIMVTDRSPPQQVVTSLEDAGVTVMTP